MTTRLALRYCKFVQNILTTSRNILVFFRHALFLNILVRYLPWNSNKHAWAICCVETQLKDPAFCHRSAAVMAATTGSGNYSEASLQLPDRRLEFPWLSGCKRGKRRNIKTRWMKYPISLLLQVVMGLLEIIPNSASWLPPADSKCSDLGPDRLVGSGSLYMQPTKYGGVLGNPPYTKIPSTKDHWLWNVVKDRLFPSICPKKGSIPPT